MMRARLMLAACVLSAPLAAQRPASTDRDSITIRLANTELRAAVQLFGQYLDRPVLFSGPGGGQVSLETPRPIARADVPRLLQSMLESQNYELVSDTVGKVYRVRPKEAPRPQQFAPPPTAGDLTRATQGGIELFVIPLRHARASDVASTVNSLYGKGTVANGSSRRGTLGDELRQIQV
ncbi:MAG: hypothetical protein ABI625_22160, partial [bacterium]